MNRPTPNDVERAIRLLKAWILYAETVGDNTLARYLTAAAVEALKDKQQES